MRRGRRRPGTVSRDAPGMPGPCRRRTSPSPPTSSRSRAPLARRRARKSVGRRSAEPAETVRAAEKENETRSRLLLHKKSPAPPSYGPPQPPLGHGHPPHTPPERHDLPEPRRFLPFLPHLAHQTLPAPSRSPAPPRRRRRRRIATLLRGGVHTSACRPRFRARRPGARSAGRRPSAPAPTIAGSCPGFSTGSRRRRRAAAGTKIPPDGNAAHARRERPGGRAQRTICSKLTPAGLRETVVHMRVQVVVRAHVATPRKRLFTSARRWRARLRAEHPQTPPPAAGRTAPAGHENGARDGRPSPASAPRRAESPWSAARRARRLPARRRAARRSAESRPRRRCPAGARRSTGTRRRGARAGFLPPNPHSVHDVPVPELRQNLPRSRAFFERASESSPPAWNQRPSARTLRTPRRRGQRRSTAGDGRSRTSPPLPPPTPGLSTMRTSRSRRPGCARADAPPGVAVAFAGDERVGRGFCQQRVDVSPHAVQRAPQRARLAGEDTATRFRTERGRTPCRRR